MQRPVHRTEYKPGFKVCSASAFLLYVYLPVSLTGEPPHTVSPLGGSMAGGFRSSQQDKFDQECVLSPVLMPRKPQEIIPPLEYDHPT
jgi:hypothetical protein